MRRLLSALSMLFCLSLVHANEVSINEAKTYALNYHQTLLQKESAKKSSAALDSQVNLVANGNLYVLNFNEGWMIMPRNNAITPVLAYSPTGSFDMDDDMPDALQELLAYYDSCVSLAPIDSTHPNWIMSTSTTSVDGVLLERMREVKWGQSGSNDSKYDCYPTYNASCPSFFGQTCGRDIVGCGAVAIGQIMWYHHWPLCAYVPEQMLDTNGNTTGSVMRSYNWDIIPTELHYDVDAHSYVELTDFLRDCGYAARSRYKSGGTTTYTNDLRNALLSMHYVADEWIRDTNSNFTDKIRASITAGKPVLVLGRNAEDTGGHFYVVFGYTSSNRYYVNWGWRGYNVNATYTMDNLEGYANNKWALCNITPNINCSPVELSNTTIDTDYYIISADTITIRNIVKESTNQAYVYSGKEVVILQDVDLNANIEIDVKNINCNE